MFFEDYDNNRESRIILAYFFLLFFSNSKMLCFNIRMFVIRWFIEIFHIFGLHPQNEYKMQTDTCKRNRIEERSILIIKRELSNDVMKLVVKNWMKFGLGEHKPGLWPLIYERDYFNNNLVCLQRIYPNK